MLNAMPVFFAAAYGVAPRATRRSALSTVEDWRAVMARAAPASTPDYWTQRFAVEPADYIRPRAMSGAANIN